MYGIIDTMELKSIEIYDSHVKPENISVQSFLQISKKIKHYNI